MADQEGEFIQPKYRNFVRIRRQFTACLCFLFGALGAGVQSAHRIHFDDRYVLTLFLQPDFLYYSPMLGEAVGIIVAIPLLYFLGRWYTLILTQAVTLVALFVSAYIYEQLIEPIELTFGEDHDKILIREAFMSLIVQHGCIRVFVISMVVYVVEVTQPSLRAPLLAAFYPFFIFGMCLSNVFSSAVKTISTAAFFTLCSLILLCLTPESPHWLARKGNHEGARASFTRLRAGDDDANELEALLESASSDVDLLPLLAGFGLALAKMVFLNMSSDNICRVFWSFANMKQYFFIYDNYLQHERAIIYNDYIMYSVPFLGSLVFLLVILFLGRRILYLTSILISLLAWHIPNKFLTLNVKTWMSISLQTCYFMTYMGARQILLIVPGELFPGRVREVGVAACQLMQLGFQYLDYKWAFQDTKEEGERNWKINTKPQWDKYMNVRWALLLLGIILTFLFLPETKDLTLLEAELAGAKIAPVVEVPFTKKSEEPTRKPGKKNIRGKK